MLKATASVKKKVSASASITKQINASASLPKVVVNPKDGIQYASYEALHTGQTTSYRIGDEGWRFQQGEFNSYILSNPETIARLDPNSNNPRLTLVDNNVFGNKKRYTAPDGTQNYSWIYTGFGGLRLRKIIDHLYGMYLTTVDPASSTQPYPWNFFEARDYGLNLTLDGYTGFSVMALGEFLTTRNYESPPFFNYEPFDHPGFLGAIRTAVSTASPEDPANANIEQFGTWYRRSGAINPAGNLFYILVKNIQEQLQP